MLVAPPWLLGGTREALTLASHPFNLVAAPFAEVNGNFVGKLVMMHRQASGATSAPSTYDDYFAKKTRRWELRLQGRFVRKPTGKLFGGVRSSIRGCMPFQQLGASSGRLADMRTLPGCPEGLRLQHTSKPFPTSI